MAADDMRHLQHLAGVAAYDVAELQRKEATYRGSWKQRGGVGAWMMAVRKIDRLEGMLHEGSGYGFGFNVFAAIQSQCDAEKDYDKQGGDGMVLAEIRDLRRYLLLIEAEMVARGAVQLPDLAVPAARLVDRVATAVDRLVEQVSTGPTAALGSRYAGLPTTLVGVRARIQQLERDNAAAPGWGAAVAARHEELGDLRALEKRLLREQGAAPAEDSNKHADRATPTPAMEEAALHTEQPVAAYKVSPSDRDGMPVPQVSRAPWRTVSKGDPEQPGTPQWPIVDRMLVDDGDLGSLLHLLQLRTGLNSKEFEDVPPWFHHMYRWDGGRNEWALQRQYARWATTGHR